MIGTDILQIKRIEKLYKKYKEHFIKRILTSEEISLINNLKEPLFIKSVAKRFAAKEAFSKALGTGIGKECSFLDIKILNDERGKPIIKMNEKIKNYLYKIASKDFNVELSISDDYPLALAFVAIYNIN